MIGSIAYSKGFKVRNRIIDIIEKYDGYDKEPETMAWVSMYSNANLIKTDFFEARSSAYAKSSAIEDDL